MSEPVPFEMIGTWVVEWVGECTCGTSAGCVAYCMGFHHEPGCGYAPLARLDDIDGEFSAPIFWDFSEADRPVGYEPPLRRTPQPF